MLRNYFCPKCGAVAEVRWWAAHTQEEYDEFWAEYDTRKSAWVDEQEKHGWRHWRPGPSLDDTRARALERGLAFGEHLQCSCPRCRHGWNEPVLAATADTPIYDELAAR